MDHNGPSYGSYYMLHGRYVQSDQVKVELGKDRNQAVSDKDKLRTPERVTTGDHIIHQP